MKAAPTLILLLLAHQLSAQLPTACYPFNGDAMDASGNDNNGTIISATPCPDRFGVANKAYQFDGVDDHIILPALSLIVPSNECTVVAWVQPISYKSQCFLIVAPDVITDRFNTCVCYQHTS